MPATAGFRSMVTGSRFSAGLTLAFVLESDISIPAAGCLLVCAVSVFLDVAADSRREFSIRQVSLFGLPVISRLFAA